MANSVLEATLTYRSRFKHNKNIGGYSRKIAIFKDNLWHRLFKNTVAHDVKSFVNCKRFFVKASQIAFSIISQSISAIYLLSTFNVYFKITYLNALVTGKLIQTLFFSFAINNKVIICVCWMSYRKWKRLTRYLEVMWFTMKDLVYSHTHSLHLIMVSK